MTADPGFRQADQEFVPAVDITKISPHPLNYNEADDDALAASLDEFGFYGAILVQKSTRHIIVGHGRYRNALAKGAATLPAFLVDVDDATAERMMPSDNQTARLAVPNMGRLVALLNRVKETGGSLPPGFQEEELAAMVAKLNPSPPDDFPEYGDDIQTEHRCPRCGYEWSGTMGTSQAPDAAGD